MKIFGTGATVNFATSPDLLYFTASEAQTLSIFFNQNIKLTTAKKYGRNVPCN